ncbi:MAG TPA: hypothetical protein VM009_05725 [Terriglobales bacterium]|nr:hypothetical protein [Terriglobales bacterium]
MLLKHPLQCSSRTEERDLAELNIDRAALSYMAKRGLKLVNGRRLNHNKFVKSPDPRFDLDQRLCVACERCPKF